MTSRIWVSYSVLCLKLETRHLPKFVNVLFLAKGSSELLSQRVVCQSLSLYVVKFSHFQLLFLQNRLMDFDENW